MKVSEISPILYANRYGDAPRQAIDVSRKDDSDAMKTAKPAEEKPDGGRHATPGPNADATRHDVHAYDFARKAGLLGVIIDVYA